MTLPTELQELVDKGILVRVDDEVYDIPALTQRVRGQYGKEWLTYTLEILTDGDHTTYVIREDSEYSGDEDIDSSNDPDDIAAKIESMIEEQGR